MDAKVKDYMTKQPHSIRPGEKLSQARRMMDEHDFRHLPVVEAGKVVGLVTERDFALLDLYPDMNVDNSTVEDLMIQGVQQCSQDEDLAKVALEMADTRHGCVVVVDSADKLQGIFTSVDALKLVGKLLS